MRRFLLTAIVIAAVLLSAAWYRVHRARTPIGIVLITLDTTRADRLSPYGLMDAAMPALDRLAREGAVFDQAISVAPLTLPAHTSLFTGLLPPAHGVRDNVDTPLAARHVTLAEILRDRGFRTGAFVGSAVLDADRGLAQGFDTYRSAMPIGPEGRSALQKGADAVIGDALAWLEGIGRRRFFLWAHLYDPHRPYEPPEPFRSRHDDPYIGEIAFADAQIGRLIDALDRRGVLDKTLIVVAGDHGESLGEHGERTHGIFVYENVLRVPLLIRAPRFRPVRTGAVVRLVDVMPTVLDLFGIDPPEVDGVSLRPLLDGRSTDLGLEAYAESRYPLRFGWSSLRSLRDGRFKVIDAPRPELYDLSLDPFETTNLYTTRRPLADAMIRRVRSVAGEHGPRRAATSGHTEVSRDLQARMAALGYVGTPHAVAAQEAEGLPDPKDCIWEDAPEHPPRAMSGCTPR